MRNDEKCLFGPCSSWLIKLARLELICWLRGMNNAFLSMGSVTKCLKKVILKPFPKKALDQEIFFMAAQSQLLHSGSESEIWFGTISRIGY